MKSSYLTVTYFSPVLSASTTKLLLGSYVYSIDLRMNYFYFNLMQDFTSSGGSGAIDLNGMPRVFLQNEYYNGGGDAIKELVQVFGSAAYSDYSSLTSFRDIMSPSNVNLYPTS